MGERVCRGFLRAGKEEAPQSGENTWWSGEVALRSRAGELQSRELSQGEGVLLSMRQGALLSPLPGTMLRILTKGGQGVTVEQGPVSTRVYPTSLCYGSQSQVRKGRNFSQYEGCQLCRSFWSICQDPIVGKGQKLAAFWTRICEDYNIRRPRGEEKGVIVLWRRSGLLLSLMWSNLPAIMHNAKI